MVAHLPLGFEVLLAHGTSEYHDLLGTTSPTSTFALAAFPERAPTTMACDGIGMGWDARYS